MSTIADSARTTSPLVATGGQTDFTCGFPAVLVSGVPGGVAGVRLRAGVETGLSLLSDFSIVDASEAGFTARLAVAAEADDQYVFYGDMPGARPRAQGLTGTPRGEVIEADAAQIFGHLQEHARDLDRALLRSVFGLGYRLGGLPLTGLGDATDDQDAVTLAQLREAAEGFTVGTLVDFPVFASVTAASLAEIAAAQTSVIVRSYGALGDGGRAVFERVASAPAHLARFRSADRYLPNGTVSAGNGGWWALAEAQAYVNAAGATGGLASDATAAVAATVAAGGPYGSTTRFRAQNYRVNYVHTQNNGRLEGERGVGETDGWPAIRPYATGAGTATMTMGDGVTLLRNGALSNLVISGDDGAGNMAEYALKLQGCEPFYGEKLDLRDGTVTLGLLPSAAMPVSSAHFRDLHIRHSGTGGGSRGILSKRLVDPGYITNDSFTNLHMNGPTGGYAVEIDGSVVAHFLTFNNAYFDVAAGHGFKLTGSGTAKGWNVIIDPGALGVPVIETTETIKNPARLIAGHWDITGNQFKYGDASVATVPANCCDYVRGIVIEDAYVQHAVNFARTDDPFSTTARIELQTNTGPLRSTIAWQAAATTEATSLGQASLTTLGGLAVSKSLYLGKGFYGLGQNAFLSFYIDGATGNGGAYIESLGNIADIDVQLVPKGAGMLKVRGSGTVAPYSDGVGNVGGPANQYEDGYFVNAPTVSSDARLKKRRGPLSEAEIRAGLAIGRNVEVWQWLSAIVAKGEEGARWHVGPMAQTVRDYLIAEGLNPADWSMFKIQQLTRLAKRKVKVTRPVMEEVPVEDLEVAVSRGKAVLRPVTRTETREKTVPVPLYNADGSKVLTLVSRARKRRKHLGEWIPAQKAVWRHEVHHKPVMETVSVDEEFHEPSGETRLALNPTEAIWFVLGAVLTMSERETARLEARIVALEGKA